jgi:predicted DsbA family dithiol-disulfide isomerase
MSVGKRAGLDLKPFEACAGGSEAAEAVDKDFDEAKRLGLRSTPTFLFGHRNAAGLVDVRGTVAGVGTPTEFYRMVDTFLR